MNKEQMMDVLKRMGDAIKDEPQPDQSRLLTLDELCLIKMEHVKEESVTRDDIKDYVDAVRTAQDAKTASIKDKEFSERCNDCEYRNK